MCERHNLQSANTLANCWRQIELASILANFFANFFVLVNSFLTCERLANECWRLSTNQNTRFVHVICVTLYKMADGREDERATFQFIEEVQNCQICGTFHLQRITTHAPRVKFLLIYGFVQSFLLFQRFLFLLRRLTYNRTKTQAVTLREYHCTTSAMPQIIFSVCCDLTRV